MKPSCHHSVGKGDAEAEFGDYSGKTGEAADFYALKVIGPEVGIKNTACEQRVDDGVRIAVTMAALHVSHPAVSRAKRARRWSHVLRLAAQANWTNKIWSNAAASWRFRRELALTRAI
jgi:hypothetical protein